MSNWDFSYVNAAPADVAAPTHDGALATDPDATTLANAGIGAFKTTDKFNTGSAQPTDLVIFSVGGNPVLQIYIFSEALGAWVVLHDNVVPTPLIPARKKLPPYSKCYIRVQTKGATTAIYAGYDIS